MPTSSWLQVPTSAGPTPRSRSGSGQEQRQGEREVLVPGLPFQTAVRMKRLPLRPGKALSGSPHPGVGYFQPGDLPRRLAANQLPGKSRNLRILVGQWEVVGASSPRLKRRDRGTALRQGRSITARFPSGPQSGSWTCRTKGHPTDRRSVAHTYRLRPQAQRTSTRGGDGDLCQGSQWKHLQTIAHSVPSLYPSL